MDCNQLSLCGCQPTQIVNFNMAFNNINNLHIFRDCNNEYDLNNLLFSYSIDSLCWSCYVSYNDLLINTVDIKSDIYIKANVDGEVLESKEFDISMYKKQVKVYFNKKMIDELR